MRRQESRTQRLIGYGILFLIISSILAACVKEEAGPAEQMGRSIDKIAGGIYDIQAQNNEKRLDDLNRRERELTRRESDLRERERELDRREDDLRAREYRYREYGYREERRPSRW